MENPMIALTGLRMQINSLNALSLHYKLNSSFFWFEWETDDVMQQIQLEFLAARRMNCMFTSFSVAPQNSWHCASEL
ncbi:hypothetical protein LOK49_LG05G02716 [Camellia lanceoleosa]|uniref:Uncharacterized protein n=1 Tax=Camellia lanceoleosa TaxID=1840588 RepID=A0ACC0HRT7_9ERIC|nr:hypothetical protein LOK49_LG05G02716 [Camellia lanceoleosa]